MMVIPDPWYRGESGDRDRHDRQDAEEEDEVRNEAFVDEKIDDPEEQPA